MITVHGERHKPYEPVFTNMPPRRKMSLSEALAILLESELGYGGQVTEVKETDDGLVQVTVKTSLLGTFVDYTWFTGNKADMEPFCKVVQAWFEFNRVRGREIISGVAEMLAGKVSTLMATNLAPMMVGQTSTFAALMIAFDVPFEEAQKVKGHKLPDVIAAVCLDSRAPSTLL